MVYFNYKILINKKINFFKNGDGDWGLGYTYYVNEKLYRMNYNFKYLRDFLINNDCKLQFYYTDISLNLSNKLNPNTTFLNSLFLQLDPTLL